MFTIRTIGGVALFLFGTTFLWLTPAFAPQDESTAGMTWAITRVLSFVTLAGLCLATWGLFSRHAWWEPVAIGSAVLGLLVLVPYWIAASRVDEPGTGMNLFVHVVGSAGVLVLLLVPQLERWVDSHVMTG
jgi:hypothetical protein